eukprot:355436-Chlamydomonas_euryale.AAC.3
MHHRAKAGSRAPPRASSPQAQRPARAGEGREEETRGVKVRGLCVGGGGALMGAKCLDGRLGVNGPTRVAVWRGPVPCSKPLYHATQAPCHTTHTLMGGCRPACWTYAPRSHGPAAPHTARGGKGYSSWSRSVPVTR